MQVAGQPLDTRGGGVTTDVFDAMLTPVREADGRVAYVHMTGSEIGDRARVEAALREGATRHRLLIESWAQAVWETDGSGVVVADSPSWRAYTGQTQAEWLGYGWLDAIHPEDRAYAGRCWPAIERARAEAAVRESEERFRAYVTASSDVIFRMSPDWSQMRQLDGRGFLADTVGPSENWIETYILPEDRQEVLATIASAICDKRMFELEHRVRQADGGVGWTLSRAVPIFRPDGAITEWLGSATDVTMRKAAEEALRASEARFRTLADTAPALIWRNDELGGNIFVNQHFLDFTGKSADAIRGEGWHTLVHPDEVEGYVADHLAAVRERRAWQHRNRIRRQVIEHSDGEQQPVLGSDHDA